MAIKWNDVSIPMRAGMTVWPGDPEFQWTPRSRIADGAGCNVTIMQLSTHTGTHCDAPWHFMDQGKRLHEVDTDAFFGTALLLDFPNLSVIRARDLPAEPLPPRILIKTSNSFRPQNGPFYDDFVALEEDAAQRLVHDGVRMVGIDALSIAPRGMSGPTHRVLLGNDVFIVEGLRLAPYAPGTYPFVVLPMPLQDADGAPCRAFIGVETE